MKKRNQLVENKYLFTFSQVAKYKSFTIAAEALYMTQPAVSQHIKKIETKLGVSIFDRSDGFELTKEGEILLKHAERGLKIIEDLYDDLERVRSKSHFKIAVSNYFCRESFEKVISELHNLEHLDVNVIYYHSLNSMKLDDYDLIFSTNQVPDHLGRSFKVKSEKYVLASSGTLNEEYNPTRIVSCSSLEKRILLALLDGYNIDLRDVTGWLSAPSTEIIKSELNNPQTLIVTPNLGVINSEHSTIETDLEMPMYVWGNKKSMPDIRRFGLHECIKKILAESEVESDETVSLRFIA
ncbi:LysR family transcriptional regulator [Photobacterium swingsii]|uniref:LysR family transcriptional regulator n=1 Tax=Photobacterium swingsii TaxID=680026 RepID=UPI003D1389F4